MITLTVELPPEIHLRLSEEAERLGKKPEVVVQEWVAKRLALLAGPANEREIDDRDREIELTRQNEELMQLLDSRGQEEATTSLARARSLLIGRE